jgi:hypothetical protein
LDKKLGHKEVMIWSIFCQFNRARYSIQNKMSIIFWRETLLKNTIFYIKLNPGGGSGYNDDLTLVQIISARNVSVWEQVNRRYTRTLNKILLFSTSHHSIHTKTILHNFHFSIIACFVFFFSIKDGSSFNYVPFRIILLQVHAVRTRIII